MNRETKEMRAKQKQALDFCKVEAVICSCLTYEQLEVAGKMVEAFNNMYNDYHDFHALCEIHNSRCEYVKKNPICQRIYATCQES